MSAESDLALSFYKEIAIINRPHSVCLVQHIDTGKVYVRKDLTQFDLSIYKTLQARQLPGIPAVSDLIEHDGTLTVIEEYISGKSIEEALKERTFSEKETSEMIKTLCRILKPLHDGTPQIIHRDIKAANIIIRDGGGLYLVDFDASKKYAPGKERDTTLMGTQDYAAPEQYGFKQSDQRTDIFSIGILMNKMLTGKVPSEEKYRGRLSHVIGKCTEIDPRRRYKNVSQLKNALLDVSGPALLKAIRKIPGFRGGWLCALGAVVWYAVITDIALTAEYRDASSIVMSGTQLILYRLCMTLLIYGETFYFGNFLGWRNVFPFRKKENLLIDVVRSALGGAIVFIVPILILALAGA